MLSVDSKVVGRKRKLKGLSLDIPNREGWYFYQGRKQH